LSFICQGVESLDLWKATKAPRDFGCQVRGVSMTLAHLSRLIAALCFRFRQNYLSH